VEDRVRILMVAPEPWFRPRGTPFSVLHRIRALLRLGHSVDLLTYPFGDDPALPGLRVQRSPRPPLVRDVAIGPSLAKLAVDLPLFRMAAKQASRGGYDLVHTHEEAGMIGAWIRRRYGIPHLYDMHSSLPQQLAAFGRFNWWVIKAAFLLIEARVLGSADAVITICPELRDYAVARGYHGPLAMIENTLDFDPPPIDWQRLVQLRAGIAAPDDRIVLYAGTLEPYQGLDLLLGAAQRLDEAAAIRFVVVGGSERQVRELSGRAIRAGVAHRFTWVPAVSPQEVFQYYRMADILVSPRSRGTNTPLKIYQYLRAEKPILATAIWSHLQVLDPSCAELVEPTANALALGIRGLADDPERRSRLAQGAAAVARTRYSEETYIDRLRWVLEQISAPSPPAPVRAAAA
jgi:glycosyltransferase involved in cell wall biosynthesis